jgi:hypothetical protein
LHRAVALAWIPNPNNYPVVNHKDGDKLNCCSANLEWTTHSENSKHAHDTGLQNTKRAVCKFKLDGTFVKKYDSTAIASKESKTSRPNISSVLSGRQITAGGFKWEYDQDSEYESG